MARLSPDDRRQAIVDATLAVARRQGLGATTVRDVAAEMGTSSGLIHHYFESMDDVLAAAFEQAAGGDLARARERIAAESDPIAQLDQFIESYAPAQSDWTMQLWLDAWAEAARRPALQRVSRRLNREWQALVRSIVERGAAIGIFTTDDADASGVAAAVGARRARPAGRRPRRARSRGTRSSTGRDRPPSTSWVSDRVSIAATLTA